ncbi:MAG: TRAP transporter fused permease subunit [Proteobacteria bacterium]|nr:TRAP transporter fused permease subunit [Pseudomonadota bacterium]
MTEGRQQGSGGAGEALAELRERVLPGGQRRLGGWTGRLVSAASVALAVLTLYMAFRVTFGPIPTRALHLVFAIPLIFLLYPAGRRSGARPSPLDWVLAAAAVATFAWAIANADRFAWRFAYVDPVLWYDKLFAVIAIAVVCEATRRTVGMTIVALNAIFIGYALTGPIWPGLLEHKGTGIDYLLEHIYMLPEGIFNIIMGIMATYLFTFLAFGAFLQVSGGERIFTDFALAFAGYRRGGPAKVAVISSALMGMLSGSTVSNVIITGSMTIPLMKRTGFQPYEAAAIESTASLGGALTPPVMGAGVFIMSAFTGEPLGKILIYSIGPAILYYASLYFYIDIKARKKNLAGLPRESLPGMLDVLRVGGHLFVPIAVLIYLMVLDFTPFLASAACVILVFVVGLAKRETRMGPRRLLLAIEASTRSAITLSALSASAAMIFGVITATGLLVKTTSIILGVAGGSLFIAIVLVGLISYVLGMGLPVTAAYVILAALGVPALVELGLSVLAAHLIIFWFSQDSTITPPICMTAFVAARIADAPPMKTGFQSVLMAKALYIIPFIFAYGSLLSESPLEVVYDVLTLFGCFAVMPAAFEGFFVNRLSPPERALFFAAGIAFLAGALGDAGEGWPWTLAGVGLAALAVAVQRLFARRPVVLGEGREAG